jgi:hypothetical protein
VIFQSVVPGLWYSDAVDAFEAVPGLVAVEPVDPLCWVAGAPAVTAGPRVEVRDFAVQPAATAAPAPAVRPRNKRRVKRRGTEPG